MNRVRSALRSLLLALVVFDIAACAAHQAPPRYVQSHSDQGRAAEARDRPGADSAPHCRGN